MHQASNQLIYYVSCESERCANSNIFLCSHLIHPVSPKQVVVKRVVDILQLDEAIGPFDFPAARAVFGGIGQYLVDKGECVT